MKMGAEDVINEGFLALTLASEAGIEPFSFALTNKTRVEVWDTGVIVFAPDPARDQGKDIVLSSGVHGNETAPVEILDGMIQSLLDESLVTVHRVLFIFANPYALNMDTRFVEENMNRLFSGTYARSHKSNRERKRAAMLEMFITRFFGQGGCLGQRHRMHYDLHTTIRGSKHEKFAVYPYQHGKPWRKSQFEFAAACGASAVLLYHRPASTFSYFSSNLFMADSLTIELGKARPFGKNKKEDFARASATLISLISGNTSSPSQASLCPYPEIFKVRLNIVRTHENFRFTFDKDVENFTDFPVNTTLAYDGSQPFKTAEKGEVVIFPLASVAIGQNAALTAIPYQLKPEEIA